MPWRRLGLIFCPDRLQSWMMSHASLPVPIHLDSDLFRVFFSTRDGDARSSIGYVDIDLRYPTSVQNVSTTPVLSPGTPGMYDDSGLGLGSVVRSGSSYRMYYMGWNLGVLAPWRNSIGMAVGDPAKPAFERFAQGPILDRSPEDPFTLSYPWVMRSGEGDWHMWYGSNTAWGGDKSDMHHVIKHATSRDGIKWQCSREAAIGFKDAAEYALARPTVIRDGGTYRMWFACRGERYRLGYAESPDGVTWRRQDDKAGLDPASDGWDSEMLCYPCVFSHAGKLYIAYNGNGYGRSGFGLAIHEP
ncbi:MAG: hypothetical protein E6Q98_21355 [Rhodospirillaceae bacterium]|nr:MAG: hypothetical protein E6Q98_21355 [Rhodospirillaceae bacterium]